MHILVVEDDAVTAELLAAVLEEKGYEVARACDGVEALGQLRAQDLALVICDWEMPRMDGLELCRAIRAQDFGRYVYIILLTARHGPQALIEGLAAGADEFMSKPLAPDELTVRLRTAERILALETRDVAIFAMAKLAESRDPETGAHLERMRNYSRLLAQRLLDTGCAPGEMSPEYVRLIYQTSPLHDIGKVGIPDTVLLKPGRLSDREFEIMKTHTLVGAETLEAALRKYPGAKYLLMAWDIAISHHERWDGSGYPRHLAGHEIPLCGRIVALADVYDALTSKRVYKQAFTHDIARSMVLKESGTHFDAAVIEAFTDTEDQFMAIQEQLADDRAPLADKVEPQLCL